MAATLVTTGLSQEVGVRYTYITDVEADWTSVPISTYFYDLETKLPYYKDSSSVVISIFESGGGDSIYTADGTLTGDRTVSQDGNLLTFNSGTTATTGDFGLKVDATGLTGSSNSTSIFNIEGKDGNYLNMTNEGDIQIRSYKSTALASFLSGDGTKGLSLSPQNGGISNLNASFLQLRGSSTNSFYTQFYHTSNTADFQMYSTGDVIQHRINVSGTSGIVTFYRDGIKSGGFIVGSAGKIGTEDISLQGDTLISKKLELSTTTDGVLMPRLTTKSLLFQPQTLT